MDIMEHVKPMTVMKNSSYPKNVLAYNEHNFDELQLLNPTRHVNALLLSVIG